MVYANSEERKARLRSVLAMFAGIALPLAVIWASSVSSIPTQTSNTPGAMTGLFLLGFNNLAQTFDPIVLVARSISGGRVNVVGLRLPEDEEQAVPLTRWQAFRRKLADVWSSVAGV